MKKLRIILIVTIIGLFAFSIQARISTQYAGSAYGCEGTLIVIKDYEYWDDVEMECMYCEETGRILGPVYDDWGNIIGYRYETRPVLSYMSGVACQSTDFENRFCHSVYPSASGSDDCDPIIKPY